MRRLPSPSELSEAPDDLERLAQSIKDRYAESSSHSLQNDQRIFQIFVQVCSIHRSSLCTQIGSQPGYEKDIKNRLTALDGSFGITNVQYRSYFPGRIWVATERSEKMKDALFRCNVARRARRIWADAVSPEELLKWEPESLPKAGQWVRARRGLYKGDLSLVLLDGDENDIVQIAVVPRLRSETRAASITKRKRKLPRPTPSIFNADKENPFEIRSQSWPPASYAHIRDTGEPRRPESLHEGDVPLKVCVQHKGATYAGGLLIKNARGQDYQLETCPMKEEMIPFVNSRVRPDVVLPPFVWLHLKTGDKVTACGSFHGATGIIADIMAQSALVRLDSNLRGGANTTNECAEIPLTDLRRLWKAGDAVKVIAGAYIGQAGHIIVVEEEPPYIQFVDNDLTISARLSSSVN